MTGPGVPLDPSMSDDYAKGGVDASATIPGKTADDRRAELRHAETMSQNVQMRHVPTGEVTMFNRSALESERLFVPALRDSFPRDQFEEFKERAT